MTSKRSISNKIRKRLMSDRNIWFATVRPDGRPHLTPLWFVWYEEKYYVCIQPESIKAKNIAKNANVAISLEDGSNVVICEGKATAIHKPWPEAIQTIFLEKYDWTISTSTDYTMLVEVTPERWLIW